MSESELGQASPPSASASRQASGQEEGSVLRRRSSRSKGRSTEWGGKMAIGDFLPPWSAHSQDMGCGRIVKCTKRIDKATREEIDSLPVSMLVLAIRASADKRPKEKHEQFLVNYAKAVMKRGIEPNDTVVERHCFPPLRRTKSALAAAALYGFVRLVRLLLDAGAPVGKADPGVLHYSVQGCHHECTRLLLEERAEELGAQLYEESLATWPNYHPTTLTFAYARNSVSAIRMLREYGNAMLLQAIPRKWETIVQSMYETDDNVLSWSPKLHWSFPGGDRRLLNWLWHTIQRQRQNEMDATVKLPNEVWLRVFGFVGRWWWERKGYKY